MNEKILKDIYSLNETSSFLKGIGSVLNVGGNYFNFNYSKTAIEADNKSINSDWASIGKELTDAKDKFEKEFSPEICLK
ncbi:MAG: hypothetical protein COB12_00645 [Flavobacterium sp.]|nr:MAG: hypothetical protein COB12_00645 [Flavobacterium sp.]